MWKRGYSLVLILCLAWLGLLLGGCRSASTPAGGATAAEADASPPPASPAVVLPSLTPSALPTATDTPQPLAAVVNGEPITLAEFQQELARFRMAQRDLAGTNLATEGLSEEMTVLNELIHQTLLAQGARERGFLLTDDQLAERYAQLAAQTDLSAWMEAQGYDEASFRRALQRSIEAAWMRDQILAGIPAALEQIHARQILLYNQEEASQVYLNLQSGADFLKLAALYDPVTAGDLGWFPRGYLSEPAVEQAVFDLPPGAFTPVIETRLGYHILQVIERDPQRRLEPDMRLALQAQALATWLSERRAASEIQVFVP